MADAPLMLDYLCDDCQGTTTSGPRAARRDLGVPSRTTPRLVRGLDYYTRTTFEFVHDGLGAQSAIGGGGRYDGLSEIARRPARCPASASRSASTAPCSRWRPRASSSPGSRRCQVFGVPLGEDGQARLFVLVAELRRAGVAADLAYGEQGLKGAMKAADRSGAALRGRPRRARPAEAGVAQVKDLASGEQIARRPATRLVTDL